MLSKPQRIAFYIVAMILPPMLVGVFTSLNSVSESMLHQAPEPVSESLAKELPKPAALHPSKPTVAILLSNAGTEVLDFMGPYELLSRTGLYNVVTVAPERRLSPTTAKLAVLPDYSFADAPAADLIVVPAVMDSNNVDLSTWLAERAPKASFILSVCEGARVVGMAGLLANRQVTSHFNALEDLRMRYPDAQWVTGKRYVEDGNLISTAGITASLDGTLAAIARLSGRRAAEKVATEIGLNWTNVNTDRKIGSGEYLRLALHGAFTWSKESVGVWISPEASELSIAMALEPFPRTFTIRAYTIAFERNYLRTRHGLTLVAERTVHDPQKPDILALPAGTVSAPPQLQGIYLLDTSQYRPAQTLRAALLTLTRLREPAITHMVAKIMESPHY